MTKTKEDDSTPEPDRRNIYQRLHGVMNDIDYIQKQPKKAGLQYSYASHDTVTAKTRPHFLKHGVVYYISKLQCNQDGNRTVAFIEIDFVNIDNPDDRIVVPSIGYGVDPGDKGPGKALSYAVKYAILKTLGLETGDEPPGVEDVDAVQDERANYKPDATPAVVDSAELGMLRGDGPSRHASREPYNVLLAAMKRNDNIDDLETWWKGNEHERIKLNSEYQHILFREAAIHAFEEAAGNLTELNSWLFTDRKEDLDKLQARSQSAYNGLRDAYNEITRRRKLEKLENA